MAFAQPTLGRARDPQLVALKVPPHSVEAEQSLLGALLLDNQAFDRVADLVTGEDFYRDDHRRIWRHIAQADRGQPPGRRGDGRRVDRGERGQGQDRRARRTWRRSRRTRRARSTSAATPSSCASARCSAASRRWPPRSPRTRSAPTGKEVGQLLDEAESKIFQIAESGARSDQGLLEHQAGARAGVRDASTTSTTATIRRTSPACRPASPISTG